MNKLKPILIFGATSLACFCDAAGGGLAPSGGPDVTMKSLDEVEPRIPISSLPYSITNGGSYYLTGSLDAGSGDGIIIETSNVTIDLMGYTISGAAPGPSGDGVSVNGSSGSPYSRINVKNGIIRNFASGINADYVTDSRFEGLQIGACSTRGIYFHGNCKGNAILNSVITASGNGINISGTGGGACNDNTIVNCSVNGNDVGVRLITHTGECSGNRVVDCTISENGSRGILLDGTSGTCEGNRILNCTLSANTDYGILATNTVACWIEANQVVGMSGGGSAYGIATEGGSDNLIIKNMCLGQTYNYNLNPNDTYGTVWTSSGIATPNSWANFSF